MIDYGFYKEISKDFDEVIDEIAEIAKSHGFGVISKVNIHEKFKEKLGIDYKKYTILGLCNPENAYKAIEMEKNIGLLLPCNAIVYEKGNKTAVAVIKPTKSMEPTNNEKLKEIAVKIENDLKNILEKL